MSSHKNLGAFGIGATWIVQAINFRPDQIVKFKELYPDQQFAPFVRNLVDMYLDGKEGKTQRIEEVIELLKKREKEVEMLKQELTELKQKKHRQMMDEALERERRQFISEHPRYFELFKAGTMSTKGYQDLQRELKLTSKQQVVEWLNGLVVE